MDKTEFQIQSEILEFLLKKGIFAWKDRQQIGKPGKGTDVRSKGVPDILGVLKGGKMLAIEVKKKGGKLSPEQADYLDKIKSLGGVAFVAMSVDDVIEGLK